ncbi:MAG TPA: hypothetical protein PLG20_02095 [Candidatus Syntrophosphaera sp.]|nr:hypothetical protein [Candidatus Syntrophosphaera sp.]
MKKAILFCLLELWLAFLGAANIRQSLTGADNLSVGDRFQLNIQADVSLNDVALPDSLSNFQVLKVEKVGKGGQLRWLRLTIVPLLPGSQSFPALGVQLANPDGEAYSTERFRLNIIPVRGEKDTTLVDIKPVEKYRWQLPFWAYPALLALMLALLGLYFWLKRAKPPQQAAAEPETKPVPEQALPPWKIALNKLDELNSLDLLAQGEYIRHHYELSMIMREFLEARYRFAAVEMTTSEIMQATYKIFIDKTTEVIRFLRYCDRVKFAKYIPSPGEAEEAMAWFRGWLQSYELAELQRALASQGSENA